MCSGILNLFQSKRCDRNDLTCLLSLVTNLSPERYIQGCIRNSGPHKGWRSWIYLVGEATEQASSGPPCCKPAKPY